MFRARPWFVFREVLIWIWTGLIAIGWLLNRKGKIIGYMGELRAHSEIVVEGERVQTMLPDGRIEIPIYEVRLWFSGFSTCWVYPLLSERRATRLRALLEDRPFVWITEGTDEPDEAIEDALGCAEVEGEDRRSAASIIELCQHERHHGIWQRRLGLLGLGFLVAYGVEFVIDFAGVKFASWRKAYLANFFEERARAYARRKRRVGLTYIRRA